MATTTLFVSNFPFATTENDLRAAFEALCPITGIRIITDRQTGRSRGFAFVEVTEPAGADSAIVSLNESMWNGRRLVVSHAKGEPGGGTGKAPNASASVQRGAPFKHRIVIEWDEEQHCYQAEVPDLGVCARGDSIPHAVREVQALTLETQVEAKSSG